MKRNIVILSLFAISCMNIRSQTVFNLPQSGERVISSEMTEYLNMEEGWTREKNLWYYYGNQVMVIPAFYTIKETIDSTYISNEREKKIRIESYEESSGSYQTSEDGWKWYDGIWTSNGDTVRSYPPSFTKNAKVIRVKVDNENRRITQTEEIEEFYQIDNDKWTWDPSRKIWLYDHVDIHKLPKYKIIKSRVVSYAD